MGQDAAFPRYRTKSGWTVKIVQLTCTPNHHDGSWIRLTNHGYFVADVRSPGALESYFPLADLEEALTAAGSGCRTRTTLPRHPRAEAAPA